MWIYIPSTSSRSAPASEDSISESDWRFQALEQSAWLRGKPLPARSWHRRWTRDRCIQRLSGRMPEPSTVERGLAEFMASLPATPASHSPSQASDEGPTTRGTSGLRSSASLGKWDPSSCSWRMSQAMFDWASTESSVTLPKSGSTRSGQLFERPMSELHTDASGSSSWPTAVAGDSRGSARHTTSTGVMHGGTTLTDAIRQWPTPRALDGEIQESPESWSKRKERKDAEGINLHLPLQVASRMWPTSGANDWKGTAKVGQRRGQLDEAAEQIWPTPTAALTNDAESPESFMAQAEKLKEQGINGNGAGTPLTVACKQMHGRQGQNKTGAGSPNTSGLRLSPRFVEWLMGFPDEWTVCEHSATPSSRLKQPSPSENSHGGADD